MRLFEQAAEGGRMRSCKRYVFFLIRSVSKTEVSILVLLGYETELEKRICLRKS